MRIIFWSIILMMLMGCNSDPSVNILVFTKTKKSRHESIHDGVKLIDSLAQKNNWSIYHTEDANMFREEILLNYDVVVFLNTSGYVFTEPQKNDFERYIQAGGGFVGVHAASTLEYQWDWYSRLVGAQFNGHPDIQQATILKSDNHHRSIQHFKEQWIHTDEWYNFKKINPEIIPLLTLDEGSYEGGENGSYHPLSWYHDFDGGRSFYTALGHRQETYYESAFISHLEEGIIYAIGNGKKDFDPSRMTTERIPHHNQFQRTILTQNLNEPMELAPLDDDHILFIERKGAIKLFDIPDNELRLVHQLNVYHEFEEGLIGLTLDPNFNNNHFIYLFYSVPGERNVQHVSRFTFENEMLDIESELVLLEVEVQRQECCHVAGSIEFGNDRLLFIATGDNTNPFASDGYAPIDERPGRSAWDAQRTSANSNNLNGKILRIIVNEDGTTAIPEGNLFPVGMEKTRPEIFTMGLRNPFRISIDSKTGWLYWGDVGPDAGKDGMVRGPKGYDELNQAREAGFFGWPYTRGANIPYVDYNFKTSKSGNPFDPDSIINDSPNNTGLLNLPPVKKSLIYYSYDSSELFPWTGTGGKNPMAGPVFHADDFSDKSPVFPPYFENKIFFYEWMRDWIYIITLNTDGNFLKADPFMAEDKFANPIDMEFSPNGTLFILEYGEKWFAQNLDARLNMIRYIDDNRAPIANILIEKTTGSTPFSTRISGLNSLDFDGDKLTYSWKINDKSLQHKKAFFNHTFHKPGQYNVQLEITDASGRKGYSNQIVMAGNEVPKIEFSFSKNDFTYQDSSRIRYKINIKDKEDGNSDNGPLPGSLNIQFKYLAEGEDFTIAGHQTNSEPEGLSLLKGSDCMACHASKEIINGPSYSQIAQKYKYSDRDYLVNKVKSGGSGVWGESVMSAHPQHTDEDLKTMINFILSYNSGETDWKQLELSGELIFDQHLSDGRPGNYILMVTYKDSGTEYAEPLTTQKIITFKKAN